MSSQPRKPPELLGKRIASYRAHRPSTLAIVLWQALALFIVARLTWTWSSSVAILAVIAVLVPPVLCLTWLLHVPRRVDLYQNGLDYRVGRRHRYVYWNQIYEIYQTPLFAPSAYLRNGPVPDSWMYRLVRRDGRSLWLYHVESIRMLGIRIQDQATRRQLAPTLDAFHAGYSVRFGRHLAISLDRVVIRRHSLAWQDIAEVMIDEANEFVVTRVNSKSAYRLPIRRVPNLLLLDRILRASQERLRQDEDPLNVAPFRAESFEGPRHNAVYDAPETGMDPADDWAGSSDSHRPRRPK